MSEWHSPLPRSDAESDTVRPRLSERVASSAYVRPATGMNRAPSLRDRYREQTTSQIVDAAFDLIETKGYSARTIEQIAVRAGISRRTFFRYFPTKEDVVFGDQGTTVARLRAGLASIERARRDTTTVGRARHPRRFRRRS